MRKPSIRKVFYYLLHPNALIRAYRIMKLYSNEHYSLSDEEYIRKMFRIKMGYNINLNNPRTFNEKINWLKLFNRQSIYSMMVDKHAVKGYVSNLIGKNHVIPEIGFYHSSQEINISILPDKFVLKTNHGCGSMIVCTDKSKIDWDNELKKLDESLKDNYYYHCREWVYKDVEPCIIAEEYMKDNDYDVLPVYKFFCFSGFPVLIQAIKNDKQVNETIDYFDTDWNRLELRQNFPNSKKPLACPKNYGEMLEIASKLTQGIPFVRCDLYSVNGQTYFSEFTFYSDAGFERFHPKKWDSFLGSLIKLPELKVK